MKLILSPNADLKPTMPPCPVEGYVGSAVLLDLVGIPAEIGNCTVSGVRVSAAAPDNSITTAICAKETDGTWSCKLPAAATSGRVAHGVQVLVDGTLRDGSTIEGYCLAITDMVVYARDMTIDAGGTSWYMHLFDTAPNPPRKGDVALVDGVLKYYDGTAWQPFADLANYYTKAQTDEAINALAAYYITANAQGAAFATYAALANAETFYSGGAARIPTRNDYAVVLEDETHGGAEWRYIYAVPTEGGEGHWEAQYPIETNEYTALQHKPQIGGVELVGNKTLAQLGIASAADATLTKRGPNHDGFTAWSFSDGNSYTIGVFYEDAGGGYIDTPWVVGIVGMYGGNRYATEADANYALANTITALAFSDGTTSFTATRVALHGYNLGSQTDKPLAGEDEAEELREKKYEKPSGGIPKTDLASGVQTSLDKADTALQSLTVLSYGTSTWADLQAALAKNAVVFCLASSNSNPATGTQSRRAFLAYLTDTEAEFQYFRSMNNHTYAQQSDQVFIYKLSSAGVWSVETRNANIKIVINASLNHTESTGTGAAMTISAPIALPWFRSTATYSVGTRVVYSNAIWECTTAVSTPGNWTGAANWTKVFDLLTDEAPTAGSTKLMTSGAIKTAMDAKASTADVTLTPIYGGDGEKYSAWTIMRDGVDVTSQIPQSSMPFYGWDGLDERFKWFVGDCHIPSDDRGDDWGGVDEDALSLAWESVYLDELGDTAYAGYTATRTPNPIVGYTLGSQTDKPLAQAGALNGVAKLPAQFTDEDVRAKINEIIDAFTFTTSNGDDE